MPRLISALLPLLLAIIACSGDEPGNTPVIANMTPTAWPVGGGPVDLTILGSNFGAGSVVILNGVDHHTPAAYDDWVGINLGAEEVATARDIGVRVRNADGLTSAAAALNLNSHPLTSRSSRRTSRSSHPINRSSHGSVRPRSLRALRPTPLWSSTTTARWTSRPPMTQARRPLGWDLSRPAPPMT